MDVVRAQVDTVGLNRHGDIAARVDQQGRSQRRVFSSEVLDPTHGLTCQRFQFARREILFAKLDTIDPGASGFGDLIDQLPSASKFLSAECLPIGDVVKKAGVGHWSSVLCLGPCSGLFVQDSSQTSESSLRLASLGAGSFRRSAIGSAGPFHGLTLTTVAALRPILHRTVPRLVETP